MRRSASEVIRNLEIRIAKLERQSGNYAFGMLPDSEREKADAHYRLASFFKSQGIDAKCGAPADDSWWCEVDATPEEIMDVVKVLRGRGQFFTHAGMEYGISSKMHKAHSLKGKGLTSVIWLTDGSSMAMPKRYLK